MRGWDREIVPGRTRLLQLRAAAHQIELYDARSHEGLSQECLVPASETRGSLQLPQKIFLLWRQRISVPAPEEIPACIIRRREQDPAVRPPPGILLIFCCWYCRIASY